VDPTLFAGANLDTRAEALSSGANHVFVVGKRLIEKGADGRNYSRALQTNTTHYFRITCGSSVGTGSFTTANIPFGMTYSDGFQTDPNNPGGYVYPTLIQDRSQSVVDPQTGVLVKPLTQPSDVTVSPNTPTFSSAGFDQFCSPLLTSNGLYHCIVPNDYATMLYGINPATGDARFLGTLYYWGQTSGVSSGVHGCYNGSTPMWDDTDPNVIYCNSDVNGDLAVVKVTYTGNDQPITSGQVAGNPPPAPMSVVNLTPSPNTLTAQLRAYAPSLTFACDIDGYQAGYLAISCRKGYQDTYAWIGAYDLGNKLPLGSGGTGHVKGLIKMWEQPASRWCGQHTHEYLGNVPVFSYATQVFKGGGLPGDGPYQVTLTSPMASAIGGDLTTVTVSSAWDYSWGSPPSGYQPGEPLSPVDDHFLMPAQVGDVFAVDGEWMVLEQKISSTQWVLRRGWGTNQGYYYPRPHSSGALLMAWCNATGDLDPGGNLPYIWWNFVMSPDALNQAAYAANFGIHSVGLGNYRIEGGWGYRLGNIADPTTWGLSNATGIISPSPLFAGAFRPADGNYFEKHPSMPLSTPPWFLDELPFIGGITATAGSDNDTKPLGGDLYQYFYDGLDTPHYGGDGINRKQAATFAFGGNSLMLDISGPNSAIDGSSSHAYQYCIANKAGECVSSSQPGDIFANVPNMPVGSRFCKGNEFYDGTQNVCIGDVPTVGFSISQIKVAADTTGQSLRVLSKMFAYAHQAGTSNTKPLPDGSWTLHLSSAPAPPGMYIIKIPPQPVSDGIDRTTFVRASLNLAPPSGQGIVSAKVYFGYSEFGNASQFYCTSRREACVAVSSSVTDANPFSYAQTDTYTPAPCATSCTIALPVLPMHTAYFHVSYLNSSGSEVAADQGVASEQAVVTSGSSVTPSSSVAVSVNPSSTNLSASQTAQFTATVTGTANTSVSWSLSPSVGSISNGLYTAPASIATSQTVTVTATSVADPTKSATASVQLSSAGAVSLAVSPLNATLLSSQTRQFTASVTGSTNTAVTWSMNPSVGSLSNGLYGAPSVVSSTQSVTITATSAADPTKSASATIQIVPSVTVIVSPLSVTLGASQTYQFTATVGGTANTGVTWSVPPSLGAVSNGLYTAPSTISASQAVTITATSVADSTKSATATVQLVASSVSISMSPPSTTLNSSQTTQITATVTGTTNTAVSWSTPAVGTLSSGLYTAPSGITTAQSVVVTATSQADPTKSGNATIQLMPIVSVSLNPTSATLTPSQGRQFVASVTGTTNTGVTWSMNPTVGSLSNGTYTAPSAITSPQTVTISAVSVVDPSKSGTATVQLMPNNLSIVLSPSAATLAPSQSTQFTPTVTGTGNIGVTWSMNPSVGSLSGGLYTAPSTISSSQTVTITATSVQDSSTFATATVQLVPNNISVKVSPTAASLLATQSTQFAATVTGTSTTDVTWTMTPTAGSLSSGLYTAPSSIKSSQNVTITATSVADPSKSASAVIHLLPKNINIRMSPQSATLAPAQSVQFTALVDGTSDGTVVWSNSGLGTVSSAGVYTAPSVVNTAQNVLITGTLLPPDGTPVATSAVITVLPSSSGPPLITWAVNAASLAGGPISPGEILAIVGSNIGPQDPATLTLDASGMVANTLGNTQVFFDGVPAPLLYAQSNQVNLVVPYSVTPGTTVKAAVAYQGKSSNTMDFAVSPYSPGVFTLGSSQGAIVNADGTVNGPDNPAARGSWVSLYGTGTGQTDPPSADGQVVSLLAPLPLPASVSIGNVDAPVIYSGSVPGMVAGVLLINVRIPAEAPAGGAVPIIFKIGDALSQPGVTVAIQ
jgi:uncharacterized protein (TIGR03437 family)